MVVLMNVLNVVIIVVILNLVEVKLEEDIIVKILGSVVVEEIIVIIEMSGFEELVNE